MEYVGEVNRMAAALQTAATKFEDYAAQHRAKGTPEADAKALVNDEMALMCRDALKESDSIMKFVPEEVRPECDYEEQHNPYQDRRCQNYSQINNLALAMKAVNLIAPHWNKTIRNTAADSVRYLFSRDLTRMWCDIVDFHHKFGLNYDGPPRVLPGELGDFRAKFLQEELDEYNEARAEIAANGDSIPLREKLLDALVDLVYVALGTAYLHGFNFAEAWRRVQRANMAKVRAERADQSKRGSTFDVVKPEGWKPPSHVDLVGVIMPSESYIKELAEKYTPEERRRFLERDFVSNNPNEEQINKHDLF